MHQDARVVKEADVSASSDIGIEKRYNVSLLARHRNGVKEMTYTPKACRCSLACIVDIHESSPQEFIGIPQHTTCLFLRAEAKLSIKFLLSVLPSHLPRVYPQSVHQKSLNTAHQALIS